MKSSLLLAAAFVGVLALIARSADETAPASRNAGTGVRPTAPALDAGRPATSAPAPSAPEARPAATSSVRPVLPAPAAAPAMTVKAPTPLNLAVALERELGLSPIQRQRAEEIFRARDAQVAEIQRRVLQSGYISARETDPQLVALREGSYRQISMLLDGEQNRRFAEVLARNSINDHMVIAVPDSLVVLD